MDQPWRPFSRTPNTVVGDLRVHPVIPGPGGRRPRGLYAWLPPGYDDPAHAARRYPVLYLNDGQALFDIGTKAEADGPGSGIDPAEWQVDETMTALHAEGIEVIVVGIPHAGVDRAYEYTPYSASEDLPPDRAATGLPAGGAAAYLDWVCERVRPLVDATLRTLPGPAHTSIGGSSLGGIVSLLALRRRPQVFGAAAVLSPAFWYCGPRLLTELEQDRLPPARIYLDVGGQECADTPGLPDRYVTGARRAAAILRAQPQVELRFVLDPHGIHHETAWAARLPDALRFLLGPGR